MSCINSGKIKAGAPRVPGVARRVSRARRTPASALPLHILASAPLLGAPVNVEKMDAMFTDPVELVAVRQPVADTADEGLFNKLGDAAAQAFGKADKVGDDVGRSADQVAADVESKVSQAKREVDRASSDVESAAKEASPVAFSRAAPAPVFQVAGGLFDKADDAATDAAAQAEKAGKSIGGAVDKAAADVGSKLDQAGSDAQAAAKKASPVAFRAVAAPSLVAEVAAGDIKQEDNVAVDGAAAADKVTEQFGIKINDKADQRKAEEKGQATAPVSRRVAPRAVLDVAADDLLEKADKAASDVARKAEQAAKDAGGAADDAAGKVKDLKKQRNVSFSTAPRAVLDVAADDLLDKADKAASDVARKAEQAAKDAGGAADDAVGKVKDLKKQPNV